MIEPIYFSLYEKVPDYRVRIFQSAHWVLDNGVALEVSIIGKSHRVISRRGKDCLTEFITCFDRKLPEQALESVCLQLGTVHDKEYRSGNLVYRVNVEQVSRLYNTMDDFLNSLGGISPADVLTHEFTEAPKSPGLGYEKRKPVIWEWRLRPRRLTLSHMRVTTQGPNP